MLQPLILTATTTIMTENRHGRKQWTDANRQNGYNSAIHTRMYFNVLENIKVT